MRLGLLDDDFVPVAPRPTDSTSHVPDTVVPPHDQVLHVVGDHPMHSYSAGALNVLSMWSHPSPATSVAPVTSAAPSTAVKVI